MKWLPRLSIEHPILTLVVLLLLTVGASMGMGRLDVDPDVLRDLPDSLPAKQLYDRVGEMFPSKEMVFVGVESEELWTPQGLEQLRVLTEALEEVPVVQQVISPTNATVVEGTAGGMLIRDAAEDFPTTAAAALAFRDELLGEKSLRGTVVSEDGEVAAIMVFLSASLDLIEVEQPDGTVRTGLTESKAAGLVAQAIEASKGELTVYPAGRPMVSYLSSKSIGKETGMLSMAALVLMTLLLGVLFRNLRGVLLPLGVVIAAVLWTMGGMGWAGVWMTHSTEALPIMLIAIGVADGVHIVQAYMDRSRHAPDKKTAVQQTMDDLTPPVVMTSITTAAGFLALNTSGVRSIMVLGILVAAGTMVALLFSLTMVPALMMLLPMPKRARSEGVRDKGFLLQRLMIRWGDLLVDHKGKAAAGIGGLVVLAIVGASQIQAETSVLENFPDDDPILVSTKFFDDHFAGVTNLQVVFEGEPGALKDPEFLARMEEFEAYVTTLDGVGGTSSILPLVRSMGQVLHGGDPAWDRLPGAVEVEEGFDYDFDEDGNEIATPVVKEVPGRQILDGYFTLFELQGRGADLANFVTDDLSSAKVTVFLHSDRKKDMDRIVSDIRTFMDTEFHGVQVEMTGMAVLMLAINDLITRGQGLSIAVSLLLVFLITTAMFRSPALGLCNVVPLFAAVFFNFGVMGLFGLTLQLMTMGVASMAIGVGVDFAIHFVHRYRVSFAEAGEPRRALQLTFGEAGVAILMNMVAVAGGFLTLLLASFKGVMTMGLLISLIMAFSAFGALTILPVIFAGIRPKAAESYKPLIVLLAVGGLALPAVAHAEPGDGRAFMEEVLGRDAFDDMVGTATLTMTTASGGTKVRVFKMASRENDEGETDMIMRMEEPADMRGNGFLVRGRAETDDDRYVYVPALGRSNRIVGSGRGGSFMSSEFSYEDIGMPDLDDWIWTLGGTAEVGGHTCQIVEGSPVDKKIAKDTGYTKIVWYVDLELKTSRQAEYWDKAGVLFKRMVVNELVDLNGVPFATDMTMTNLANGRTSRMQMTDLAIDQGTDPAWFSNRALQKGF